MRIAGGALWPWRKILMNSSRRRFRAPVPLKYHYVPTVCRDHNKETSNRGQRSYERRRQRPRKFALPGSHCAKLPHHKSVKAVSTVRDIESRSAANITGDQNDKADRIFRGNKAQRNWKTSVGPYLRASNIDIILYRPSAYKSIIHVPVYPSHACKNLLKIRCVALKICSQYIKFTFPRYIHIYFRESLILNSAARHRPRISFSSKCLLV